MLVWGLTLPIMRQGWETGLKLPITRLGVGSIACLGPDTAHHETGNEGIAGLRPDIALCELELLVSGQTLTLASLRGWEMLVFHKEHVLCAS